MFRDALPTSAASPRAPRTRAAALLLPASRPPPPPPPSTAKRRRLGVHDARRHRIPATAGAAAAAAAASSSASPSRTPLPRLARLVPPSPQQYDEFEALWLAERLPLSLSRTAAAWALRDVERGALPCDARLLARRARALAATGAAATAYDGRALLQAHPAALSLDSDELREALCRVLQLLPASAREDPTGLAMAALSPLASLSAAAAAAEQGGGGQGGSRSGWAERVALAHEELGAVVTASSSGALRMGPRLFAWLFDQQQQQQQQQQQKTAAAAIAAAAPSLPAGLAALGGALGGPELASAALERAPELALASGDAGELSRRVAWLRDRLGVGADEDYGGSGEYDGGGGGGGGGGWGAAAAAPPPLLLLLPARLAAALSTASSPDASAGRAIVSPARATPRDPADLPIRSPEALTPREFAGGAPEHALCSSPLAAAAALDDALAAAARLLRRRAGWPPGAAVRFLRAYPGALAWDWSAGGACDRAFAEVEAAARRRGGRWPLALRTSPAAVAAALAAPRRARRRLRFLGSAPGALAGVGLRRALAMPEVDFLEACPGYRVWRLLGIDDEEEEGKERGREAEDAAAAAAAQKPPPPPPPPPVRRPDPLVSDLIILGELRKTDRML